MAGSSNSSNNTTVPTRNPVRSSYSVSANDLRSENPWRINQILQSINGRISDAANAVSSVTTIVIGGGGNNNNNSSTSGNIYTQLVSVTGVTTIFPIAAASNNSILYVIATQDGTGHTVSWSGSFKFPPTIPTTANTQSVIMFVGNPADSLWYYSGASVLGRHK